MKAAIEVLRRTAGRYVFLLLTSVALGAAHPEGDSFQGIDQGVTGLAQ